VGAYKEYLASLPDSIVFDRWHRAASLAARKCIENGVTSFQDAGSTFEEIRRYEALAGASNLPVRLWAMIYEPERLHENIELLPILDAGGGFFSSRAVKVYVDGALGSYGAWMLEPYLDKAGHTGYNTGTLHDLQEIANLCAVNDLQLCTHAIGDRANREVLDIYERTMETYGLSGAVRWRIEHAQHIDPDDIPRFGTLGVIPAMQGIHCTSDAPFVEKRLGISRARTGAYPWRSLLDNGAIVANGTDTPVEEIDPIACFYALVTRKRAEDNVAFYPEQAMTRKEALYAYTMANAIAAFEERDKGSLEPGKYADLVVLSRNLITCDDEDILDSRVLLTIVGGQVMHQDPDF
jgi:predicted amidohydrolase YtcJ